VLTNPQVPDPLPVIAVVVAAPAAGAQAVVPNAEADAAMAAALAAEDAEDGDEVAEIQLGKRIHLAFPGLLLGHVAVHWLDRVKTEVQVRYALLQE
jgi:hypothetical protein